LVCIQQIVEVAKRIGFGCELFLLRMVELEILGLIDVEHIARLYLWILGCITQSKKSKSVFMVERNQQLGHFMCF